MRSLEEIKVKKTPRAALELTRFYFATPKAQNAASHGLTHVPLAMPLEDPTNVVLMKSNVLLARGVAICSR